jgi:hypothetical protein
MLAWRIIIIVATNLYGQDYRPRKKSPMDEIMKWLIAGGIASSVLIGLVVVLRYGTAGHSAP